MVEATAIVRGPVAAQSPASVRSGEAYPPRRSARPHRAVEVWLDEPLPRQVAVGGGTAIFLRGRCRALDGCRIDRLSLLANGADHPLMAHGIAPSTNEPAERWWGVLPISPVARAESVRLSLRASFATGEYHERGLGELRLEPAPTAHRIHLESTVPGRPLVAICMATFNPPLDLFERQVESIRSQTFENWICVISDDHSRPECLDAMRRILRDDPRFHLFPSTERRGYYGNFERALGFVPPQADYVGLADQDDYWHPTKLDTLCATLGDGSSLAYSDMRVVDRDQSVLSDTFWRYRRHNCTNLASLLITNAITGAASLFRRELLDLALPFPPPQGDIYHDHWIALVAMATGDVRYVDRPLYDYVQHPDAALGYTKAMGGRGRWGGRLADLIMRFLRLGWRLIHPVGESRYFENYCRIVLEARALELRCGDRMTPSERRALRRIESCDRSILGALWFAARSLRPLIGRNETMGMERGLAAAIVWRRRAEWRSRVARIPAA
jgi:glycosyltransferase involved in cell wall biosynthesis